MYPAFVVMIQITSRINNPTLNSNRFRMAFINGLDLSQFNAAGTYTIIRDETAAVIAGGNNQVGLVAGFSRLGRFNTGILIEQGDTATAERLYGSINRGLERQGSFFHRALRTCLTAGPAIALNLLNLNNEVDETTGQPTPNADVVPYRSFSLDTAEVNGATRDKLYASYYNKERFWRPDRRFLLATREATDDSKILNLVNLSQRPYTFLIRKSNIRGFDVPVSEYYPDEESRPGFLRPYDLISDYFIDITVISGNFGPDAYNQLAVDPLFGQYFNQNGLIAEKTSEFLNLPEVVVQDQITGTIIPSFTDEQGTNYYIEELINSRVNTLGILCAINVKELDKFEFGTNGSGLDLVGHNLIGGQVQNADFLSYKRKLFADFTYDQESSNPTLNLDVTSGVAINSQVGRITVTVDNTNPIFAQLETDLELNNYVAGVTTAVGASAGIAVSNPVLRVSRLIKNDTQIVFDLTSSLKDGETPNSGSFVDVDLATVADTAVIETEVNRFELDGTSTFYLADINSPIYSDWVNGDLTDGDVVSDGSNTYYLRFNRINATSGIDDADDFRTLLQVQLFLDAELLTPITAGSAPTFGTTVDSNGFIVTGTRLNIQSLIGSVNERIDATQIDNQTVEIDVSQASKFRRGYYLVGQDLEGNDILTRITNIVNVGSPAVTAIRVSTAQPVKLFTDPTGQSQVERFLPVQQFFDNFDLTYLRGFKIRDIHLPNNTNARMREIYGVIDNTNIRKALVDPDFVNWRYFIDTFNHGLEGNSKAYLARLVRDRGRAIGLLNTPTFEEFQTSVNPRFTDSPTPADPFPVLNTQYILDGANLDENPDVIYTLPSQTDGASHVAFFAPNFILNTGDGEEVSFPPAPAVATAFLAKFTSANPYLPAAGPINGQIGGVDSIARMEYELFRDDRGNLEQKGINPIILKNGVYQIYGDQSAYQSARSTLNRISARDALVTFDIETTRILDTYTFQFNSTNIRNEVRTLLLNYYQRIQNSFGAIEEVEVIFNESNNPEDLIRESIGLVDTRLKLPGIFTRFVNRITLFRDAAPSSGGFVAV